MSTFKHPVGPQSSRVYWRRRLLVGLGLIAVIVVIILIVVRPGSSEGAPVPVHSSAPPAPAPSGTPSADGASTPSPSGTPGASASASATAASQAAADAGKPCSPSRVQVKAATDASSYAAGALPKLTVSITNTGTASCTIDAGTGQQVFTITSGSETYWRSSDCQADKADAQVLLQPGKTISSQTPLQWDRTRSDPATCQQPRQQVPAGGASYHLAVTVAGIASSANPQFSLR